MVRQAFKLDPDQVDDESWCKLYAEALFLNKLQFYNTKVAIMAAVSELFGNGSTNDTMDT